MKSDLYNQFKNRISLFKDLPDDIFLSLDLSHFHLPDDNLLTTILSLEKRFNHYIVTYNADIFRLDIPIETHLCAIVKGADLTEKQLMLLNQYEKILKPQNITLVVFQKPLVITPVQKSALYKKYQELNLL